MQYFFTALFSVIPAGIIIMGLSSWLGKVWAERILEKEKLKYQKELEEIKENSSIMIEKIKNLSEKDIFIHKVQFEKEFNVYNELWDKLMELYKVTSELRPIMEFIPKDKTLEDIKKEKLDKYNVAFTAVANTIYKCRPFYSEDIYKIATQILKIANEEGIGFDYTERHRKEYYQEAKENMTRLNDSVELICQAIRSRIQSIVIIE